MGGPLEALAAQPYLVLGILAVVLAVSGWFMRNIAQEYLVNDDIENPFRVLERARTKREMDRIVSSWGPAGCRKGREALVWDLPFLLAYGAGLSLLCSLGAVYFERSDAAPAAWVWTAGAWLVLAAPILDLVENVLLWRMLSGQIGNVMPGVKAVASKLKWRVALWISLALALPALAFDLAGCRFGCPTP